MEKGLESFQQLIDVHNNFTEVKDKLDYLENLKAEIDDKGKLKKIDTEVSKIKMNFDEKAFRKKIDDVLEAFQFSSDKQRKIEVLKSESKNPFETEILNEYYEIEQKEGEDYYRNVSLNASEGRFDIDGNKKYKEVLLRDYNNLIDKWLENVKKATPEETDKRKEQINVLRSELLPDILNTVYDTISSWETAVMYQNQIREIEKICNPSEDTSNESLAEINLDYLKRYENGELFKNDEDYITNNYLTDEIMMSNLFKPFRAFFDLIDLMLLDWSGNEQVWSQKVQEINTRNQDKQSGSKDKIEKLVTHYIECANTYNQAELTPKLLKNTNQNENFWKKYFYPKRNSKTQMITSISFWTRLSQESRRLKNYQKNEEREKLYVEIIGCCADKISTIKKKTDQLNDAKLLNPDVDYNNSDRKKRKKNVDYYDTKITSDTSQQNHKICWNCGENPAVNVEGLCNECLEDQFPTQYTE